MEAPPGKGGASCRAGGKALTVHSVIVDAVPGATTRIEVSILTDDRMRSDASGLHLDYKMTVLRAEAAFATAGLAAGRPDHLRTRRQRTDDGGDAAPPARPE